MPQHIRVLQNFTVQTDAQLINTANAFAKGLPGSPLAANSPVDPKTVQTAADDLAAAVAAQPNAGLAGTAIKKNKRDALVVILRKLVHYVQDNCGGDPAVVLSVGFAVATSGRTGLPIETPSIVTIDFGNTKQLVVRANPVPRARCYELQTAAIGAGGTPGAWQSAGLFRSARSMTVDGLTPGTTYTIQVRAFGGSGGFTDWSNPVSHIAV